jgi:hypothetical protein
MDRASPRDLQANAHECLKADGARITWPGRLCLQPSGRIRSAKSNPLLIKADYGFKVMKTNHLYPYIQRGSVCSAQKSPRIGIFLAISARVQEYVLETSRTDSSYRPRLSAGVLTIIRNEGETSEKPDRGQRKTQLFGCLGTTGHHDGYWRGTSTLPPGRDG